MVSIELKRENSCNSQKNKCSAESVIEELKEKMSRLKFRLLDYQNQNQMLRKELLLAKKVIKTEIAEIPDENFHELLNLTDFRGRQEKILILKDKLSELQNRIKKLEDGNNNEKPPEDLVRPTKVDRLEEHKKSFQNRKMIDKELQYLLESSCQLKRKLEVWKKRNTELSKEAGLLRLELDRLLDKSKEVKSVHESYLVVDKELRARQSEKLDLRSKLDLEKTRNEQLSEELAALKEDISMILSKINDDKVLIDALKSQQGCLIDLLERQKFISESDGRKFQDDMSEVQAKHATNRHVLDHLKDIVDEKTKRCRQVQESMKDEFQSFSDESEKQEFSISITTDSEITSSQSESQQSSPIPADEVLPENEETQAERAMKELKEEVEQQKSILQSFNEQMDQLTNIAFSNNNKMNQWMSELFQTNSLLAQKNAEIRDLEETSKKLQKPTSFAQNDSTSTPQGPNFAEEMQKKNDLLQEEYQFLLALWDLLISNKENSLEVLFMSTEFSRKQFINAIIDLIPEEDISSAYEESLQIEEQS